MSKKKKDLKMSTRQIFVHQTVLVASIMWIVVHFSDSAQERHRFMAILTKKTTNLVFQFNIYKNIQINTVHFHYD
jgi:hypothetical protein